MTHALAATAPRVVADGTVTTEHVVYAYGSFLGDAAALQCVDWRRCTSNDIWETYHLLGIEACVHVFFDQLRGVVSFDGRYVDERHLLMIVDTVCRGGTIMSLNRHCINRTDASPLMRCSYEETTDILLDAALFSETENARCVTTCVMSGQLANMGTGTVDVQFRTADIPRPQAAGVALRPAGRVLRSTCRSHVVSSLPEVMEYVVDDVRPQAPRPLSPTMEDARRRFRPASPPLV